MNDDIQWDVFALINDDIQKNVFALINDDIQKDVFALQFLFFIRTSFFY